MATILTRGGEEGNVGVGAGATVGKLFDFQHAMKGGVGTASLQVGLWTVGALVVVNCAGDVLDPTGGRILAGARRIDGKSLMDSVAAIKNGEIIWPSFGENTTLGVVATNARLGKAEVNKLAQMSQDGLARAINPVHTPFDGDTVFALATGEQSVKSNEKTEALTMMGTLAAEAVSLAICRAVTCARRLPNLPSYSDLMESGLDAQ